MVERRREVVVAATTECENAVDGCIVGAAEHDDRRLGREPLDLGSGASDHDVGAYPGTCDLEPVLA